MSQLNHLKLGWIKYLNYFSLKLLVLLLITDLLLILFYIFCWLPSSSYLSILFSKIIIHEELLWITEDQSYAEIFQYIKELWIVLILGFGYLSCKKFIFLAWTLLFNYVLLDDFLSIHETVGSRVSNFFQFQDALNLRAVDFGEILVSATVGISFLILISWAHSQSNYIERKYGSFLIFFLFTLAITGIFFDLIHVVIYDNRNLNLIFALLEDGGEQIAMSFTLAFVYAIDWKY